MSADDHGVSGTGSPDAVAAAMLGALRDTMPKPDLYLVRAAQATTLRQLKSARKQLRDFNAASAQQLEAQLATMEEAAGLLVLIRADLDAIYRHTRALTQQLQQQRPDLYAHLLELQKQQAQGDDI